MAETNDLKKIILRKGLIILLLFLLADVLEHLTSSGVISFFREGTPFERFALLVFIILVFPPLCEKIGIPAIVGLVGAGIILGPHVMNIGAPATSASQTLYSLGKLFLLFLVGLEMDVDEFQQKKDSSILFGAFSLGFSLLCGTLIGRVFGYSWNASILIGSLFASYTLISFHIIHKIVKKNHAIYHKLRYY